jgi:hypothetical protein
VAYRTSPFDQDSISSSGGGDDNNEGGNANTNSGRRKQLVVTRILEGGNEIRGGGNNNDNNSGGAESSMIQIRKNNINRRYNPHTKQQQQQQQYNQDSEGNDEEDDPRCPLSFRLGLCHGGGGGRSSGEGGSSTTHHTPPIIYPLHPDDDAGSGRQILLSSDWEMLELWTPTSSMGVRDDYRSSASGTGSGSTSGGAAPATGYVQGQSTEQMKVDEQFPLLFEGSSFYHTSPIIHDISGDGVPDAILGDYDGTIHIIGLDFEPENHAQHHTQHKRRQRSYKRISIPRLYIRKYWYEYAINRTKEDETTVIINNMNTTTTNTTETNATSTTKYEEFEPYHTYFALGV